MKDARESVAQSASALAATVARKGKLTGDRIVNPHKVFEEEVNGRIKALAEDEHIKALSLAWTREITPHKYTYNFRCLGRLVIHLPPDFFALPTLILNITPHLFL